MTPIEKLAKTNPDLVIELGGLSKEALLMIGKAFNDLESKLTRQSERVEELEKVIESVIKRRLHQQAMCAELSEALNQNRSE